jgi:hypothetical protein
MNKLFTFTFEEEVLEMSVMFMDITQFRMQHKLIRI